MEREYSSEELEILKDFEDFEEENIEHERLKRESAKIRYNNEVKENERKIKLRIFKKCLFVGLTIGVIVGGINLYKANLKKSYKEGKNDAIEEIKKDALRTCNLTNAPDKIVIEWANSAFNQYSSDIQNKFKGDSNEKIQELKESYYNPLMREYYEYVETKNQDNYNNFRNLLIEYEKNLNSSLSGRDYSFDNSIFSYAVLVDAENNIVNKDDGNTRIFIAEDLYYETSDTITISEGSIVRDGKIYKPYDSNEFKISYSK